MTKQIVVRDATTATSAPGGVISDYMVGLMPTESKDALRDALDIDDPAQAPVSGPQAGAIAAAVATEAGARSAAIAEAVAPLATSEALALTDAKADSGLLRIDALTGRAVSRPGDARSLFSAMLTGAAAARAPLGVGTVVVDADLGAMLRIGGADVPVAFLDVAARVDFALEPGRTYRVRYAIKRTIDAVDPLNNAVEIRWQNLNQNKANVSNVRLGEVLAPTVAAGVLRGEFLIGKAGATGPLDYTIPPTALYGLPLARLFGSDHQTGIGEIDVEDVTDVILTSAASAGALAEEVAARQADVGEIRGDLDTTNATTRAAARVLSAPTGATVALRDGVYPLVEQDGHALVAVNLRGEMEVDRLVSRDAPDTALRDGILPVVRGTDRAALMWYDFEQGRMRWVGDAQDRARRQTGLMTLGTDQDALVQIDGDGEVYTPGADATPVLLARSVDDGAGAVSQIFAASGSALLRLTAANVDCLAPRLTARGLVKYARADGSISLCRFPRAGIQGGSDIAYHAVHGQSLAGGSVSYTPGTPPIVAHPPSSRGLMFNGGVRAAFGTGAASAGNFASLVPAAEALDGSTQLSDTGMTNLAFALSNEIGKDVLVAATGSGGLPYDAIKKGTVPWDNLIYGVTRGKDLADAASRAFAVEAMHWRQGESNEDTPRATYRGYIQEAYSDFVGDVTTITGQSRPPLMLLQQIQRMVASTRQGTGAFQIAGPGAAVSDLGTTMAQDGILVIAPQYICDFGDVFHMRPSGYNLMTAYGAKAVRRHLYQGMPWRPLQAISGQRVGKTVLVTMAGGWLDWGGALALDTSWVSDPGQYGIVFHDRATAAATAAVRAVRVIGRDQIEIALSATPGGGEPELLGFAWWRPSALNSQGRTSGLRCCLRDNDPDACAVTGRPLHNYAISHTITLN